MTSITRADQSVFLESFVKKAFCGIERISHGVAKKDPFEGKVDGEVWQIVGNKLVRNNKKGVK